MTKYRDNYFNEFSLAFIEELQQGGISFIDMNNKNFIENEYPHFNEQYTKEMLMIHKWWLNNDDKLSEYKRTLYLRLYTEVTDRISSDPYYRFMIIKSFHDSYIADFFFDSKNRTLTLIIDYDDCFCKTKFGKNIALIFYSIEQYSDNLIDIINLGKNPSGIIYGIESAVKNDKLEFNFDLAFYGTLEEQKFKLICTKIHIKST